MENNTGRSWWRRCSKSCNFNSVL